MTRPAFDSRAAAESAGGFDVATPGKAHLVGSAGAGMQTLAAVLGGWGWQATGSDTRFAPHAAEHVPPDADVVIFSDAVGAENCELRRAVEVGIPTLRYAQFLAQMLNRSFAIAVAGTHGKSTTTAMTAEILRQAGLAPTVICGGTPIGQASGGVAGSPGLLLAEACEYRANLLGLRPQLSVVLNIELDHFETYADLRQLHATFDQFARQTSGRVLVGVDCPAARRLAARLERRCETFALDRPADWQATDLESRSGQYRFTLVRTGERLGRVELRPPGRHNVANALAAAALAHAAGAEPEFLLAGLSAFAGLQRRLEVRGCWAGVTWVDDYAHHPTEIAAALAAAREMAPLGRIWCVFQPHQTLRTARLLDDFAQTLQNADRILIAEIFRARENLETTPAVTAADLARAAGRLGGSISPRHDADGIVSELTRAVREGELSDRDIVLTLGAGNIGDIADEVGRRL